MDSSLDPARQSNLSAPVDGDVANDPFVTTSHPAARQRFSNFDQELFALGPGSSPGQARRALEAHLAETDRRLDEAGKLGTALVSQRKLLAQQIEEIHDLQGEGELGPDLRKKLVDIEREYNDLARESARVFLPKQRIPSNEAHAGSPFAPDGRSGRRSVSPSKFESQATGSPTKLSVPNRKLRNQPSNRNHDIEFATEISTSLIAQVRNLQSLLSERDSEFKDVQSDKSRLEIESENLQQRLRSLDESETRYREENWNLETRLQELNAQQREAADREKKLAQALNSTSAEKVSAQKELDDVKLSHSRLAEEHAAAVKHLDIELGTAKRNMVTAESERTAMQRTIDDLTHQNEELARAFSSQHLRTTKRESIAGLSDDDLETTNDNITPEHSPPPSPVKNTPRHSMLEAETIKSSLNHAQRTIQSQRSQLHREKTEKLELRRIVQDLRDDLERARNQVNGGTNPRRSRKVDSKEFKKTARLLGSHRSSRQEILPDDPDWEDNAHASLSGGSAGGLRQTVENGLHSDRSDQFDTANEASESAFETANERATETEDFQTGNEAFSGSDDDDDDDNETETEDASRGFGRMKKPPSLSIGLVRGGNRGSFRSTASTSPDEDELPDLRTPTAAVSSQRSRFRLSRGPFLKGSRNNVEDSMARSSPASYTSGGTPQAPGQSLFAELENFGSDEESMNAGTPSKQSIRSATPGSAGRAQLAAPAASGLSKVSMADSGVMTDPVHIAPDVFRERLDRPASVDSVVHSGDRAPAIWQTNKALASDSRPESTMSYSDASVRYEDLDAKLAEFPVPPSSSAHIDPPTPPSLGLSDIQFEAVEPLERIIIPPTPPALSLTTLAVEHVEPRAEAEVPLPPLILSRIASQSLEPVAQSPDSFIPRLTMASISTQEVEPKSAPLPLLALSGISAQALEPVAEPERTANALEPSLTTRAMQREHSVASPSLGMSPILAEHLEPREEPAEMSVPPVLQISGISAEAIEPISEPQPPVPTLALSSSLATQHITPIEQAASAPTTLAFSNVFAEHVEPDMNFLAPRTLAHPDFSILNSPDDSAPAAPRSPKRDAFILPRDVSYQPETPNGKTISSIFARGKKRDEEEPIIAEDETRQSLSNSPDANTPDSERPFKEISANSNVRPARKPSVITSDQSSQTSLTAGAIDLLLRTESHQGVFSREKNSSISSIGTQNTTGTVRRFRSQESLRTIVRTRSKNTIETVPVRPGSAASGRDSAHVAPPLPSQHRRIIEAARSGSSHSQQQSSMGPPLWPASAMKHRPQTPSQPGPSSPGRETPTPRVAWSEAVARDTAEPPTPARSKAPSRGSSVSSFVSEIDSRFNIRPGDLSADPSGLASNTDPRMIQAITQTMIGEFLWKYTRKTGRGEMSEKRHRRYFWVHPYTRTLYWSDKDPSTAGRSELKAKSVPIEAVRVVTDDNPMPPGLHRKSMIIISPGRTIKFTCTTGQRHETWFNALSYLLLRTGSEHQSDAEELAGHITQQDVDEFNPQFGRRSGNEPEPKATPSLSSYNSRTTRNESPALDMSMNIPTLTPSGGQRHASTTSRASVSTLGKLSGYWRSGAPKLSGTLSSFRGRGAGSQNWDIYEASEAHDSAEDVREIIERQDREADRMENVRACCDGKHDVGSLPHATRRGRGQPSHSHPAPVVSSASMVSMRSRA